MSVRDAPGLLLGALLALSCAGGGASGSGSGSNTAGDFGAAGNGPPTSAAAGERPSAPGPSGGESPAAPTPPARPSETTDAGGAATTPETTPAAADAGLPASAAGDASAPAPAITAGRKALLVGGNVQLGPGDTAWKKRLEDRGFEVSFADGAKITVEDAAGKALVVVTSSIKMGQALAPLRPVEIPIIAMDPGTFGALGMTGSDVHVHYGSNGVYHTELEILDPAHPLAAGFKGRVAVTTAPARFAYAKLITPPVMKVAAVPSPADRFSIFAYERGAAMFVGKAPARRVGFFCSDVGSPLLSADGLKLFHAAIDWALAAPSQ